MTAGDWINATALVGLFAFILVMLVREFFR